MIRASSSDDRYETTQGVRPAFAALGSEPTAAELQGFLSSHPATPEILRARSMLAQLETRLVAKDQALAVHQAHWQAKRWEQAWQTGTDLVQAHGRLLTPGQVQLPLVIESVPTL